MTDPSSDVAAAQVRAAGARARFVASVGQVKERLKPATLAQDAADSATNAVKSAANKGVEAVRTRPVAAAAAVGALGLFLSRKWLWRAVHRRDATAASEDGLKHGRAGRAKKGNDHGDD